MSAYKLFPPKIIVNERDGFKPELDIFGRKYIGMGVKNLLETVEDPLVLCVDGEWGTGKTTFLQMLAGELRTSGFPIIAFDAFENDYIQDPFVAISARIFDELLEHEHKTEAAQFKEKATKLAKQLRRAALNVGVKIVTAGALGAIDIEGLAENASEAIAEVTDKQFGEAITANKDREKTISDFKELLASAHVGNLAANATARRPLVIIIDEIDRCRPDFALKLIERIKHFFSVTNVQFILGANMSQLEKCVGSQYGLGLDARTYLQKFISFSVPITNAGKLESHRQGGDSEKYATNLIKHSGIASHHMGKGISLSLQNLVKLTNLSFRSTEKLITKVALFCALDERNGGQFDYFYHILVDLAYLWLFYPQVYRDLQRGAADYRQIKGYLCLNDKQLVTETSNRQSIQASIWCYFCGEALDSEHEHISRELSHHPNENPAMVFQRISQESMETIFPF